MKKVVLLLTLAAALSGCRCFFSPAFPYCPDYKEAP